MKPFCLSSLVAAPLADPKEAKNIAAEHPEVVQRMLAQLHDWPRSGERSLSGADY